MANWEESADSGVKNWLYFLPLFLLSETADFCNATASRHLSCQESSIVFGSFCRFPCWVLL